MDLNYRWGSYSEEALLSTIDPDYLGLWIVLDYIDADSEIFQAPSINVWNSQAIYVDVPKLCVTATQYYIC